MAKLSIRPMPVGAEVLDFVPGMESHPEVQAALYDAWLAHGILLFRNVDTVERHLAISRCFGELEIHPVPEVRSSIDPYFIELGSPAAGGGRPQTVYVFDGETRINRIAWHRDTAYTPDICKGAMLRMVEVPEAEGETLLADTAMAWDDLPADVQQRLERLEFKATIRTAHLRTLGHQGVFWKKVELASDDDYPGNRERCTRDGVIDGRYPSVIHPAVLTHPESGRKCIFLSPTYVDLFLGLEQDESDALLAYLTDHMLSDRYVYKHKWRENDAIVWDNRRFMHAGMGNRPGDPRFGLRTTLAGPLRTGRYFDEGVEPVPQLLTDSGTEGERPMAKYLRYETGGGTRYGRLDGTTITPLEGEFADFRDSGDAKVELADVRLLAPVQPTRIVSCGPGFKCSFPDGNYPDMPSFWHKPLVALNHPEGVIELPDNEYPGINHEAELGIVIGTKAKCVSPEQAGAHIFGYTCYNDVTRGDFYEEGAFARSPYFAYGKTYEGFAPIGPWIVTGLDTSNLHIECRINGEVRQSHSTSDRLFTPEQLVSFVSHLGTLNPGDVLSCGSPPGMTWMKHGDVCEVEIEGIGVLRNHVRDRV